MLQIHSAYLSKDDSIYDSAAIFRPGETIRYNVVHSITPYENVPFRLYGVARRMHLNGVVSDPYHFETVWRPVRLFTVDGSYTAASLLNTLSSSVIPADPSRAFNDAIVGIHERRRALVDLLTGEYALEYVAGYWSFTAYLGLLDTASDEFTGEMVASWPYTYQITEP